MQKRAARISKYKMINFDDNTNENKTELNPKRGYIPNHLYRLLIIEVLDQEKQNINI